MTKCSDCVFYSNSECEVGGLELARKRLVKIDVLEDGPHMDKMCGFKRNSKWPLAQLKNNFNVSQVMKEENFVGSIPFFVLYEDLSSTITKIDQVKMCPIISKLVIMIPSCEITEKEKKRLETCLNNLVMDWSIVYHRHDNAENELAANIYKNKCKYFAVSLSSTPLHDNFFEFFLKAINYGASVMQFGFKGEKSVLIYHYKFAYQYGFDVGNINSEFNKKILEIRVTPDEVSSYID